MTEVENPRDAWTAFGLGAFGGVIAGLTLLSFAGLQVFGILALVIAIAVRPRPFAAAGTLIGIGVSWLLLLVGAAARCDPGSCSSPDLTPWLVVSIALLTVGAILLGVGIGRARGA